ncbi:MAG: iron ABC transporter permease [Cutibacterium avidum]|nr:iron ABC transporter permease [Cutibacterium avidum]
MSLAREDPATGMVAVVRGYYRRARWKRWAIVLLSVIAVAAFLVTIVVGPVDITLPQLLRALVNPSTVDAQTRMVLWQLRIPSSVMAVLIGVCLSLAGAHMQTILDNPLAEPFTLGISAAAAFGAAASIVLGWTIIPNSQFNVAVCAAVASLVAVAIVAAVSRRREDGRESMILLGIALVFGFHALLALLQYRATPEALQQIVFWTMGSLQRATWTSNAIIAAVLAIAIPITIRHSGQLTALRLGDERAAAMGANVPRLRSRILILASLLAAVTVAFAGVIGFVGLVGPHVARILVGEEQRYFAPASAATGAFLLATAHALSITIIPGVAIPIGIITALVGVPVFVSLILTRHRVFGGAS